ncbi:TonB-dependent receptor plug domain-containing protein [Holophaga foetida]|uniref:TonB-dependent receptor plug domain-containing protein n=1 Tax=Holophaga foetida TaxID=35839 RepID=UPI0002474685|nr:TonB-dependent receptor [Holophaga foetida]
MKHPAISLLGTLLVAAPLSAEAPATLPAVVVTDTKVAQPQSQVTQHIDVLDQEQLEQQTSANRNIAELLQYRAGVFVDTLSRNDANWGSFGGIGPKYSTYLLDGLPIDSFADAMNLDPSAFQQVEMHKGPASVMYSNYLTMDFAGNEAPLAGITNFLLKDRVEGPATRLSLGYGSYNTYTGRLYHQDRKGNLNYFFGAGLEKSDYTDYGTQPSWLNFTKDPEYQKTKLYAKVSYLFDREDHRISLFINHTQHEGDAGRPNRDYNHGYDTINLNYFNQFTPALSVHFKTGYRSYDRRWAEDNYPTNLALREHDGVQQKIIPTDLTFNYRHGGNSLLTFGADSQFATYHTYAEVNGLQSTGNDVKASSMGLFAQEKLVVDKWVFRAGGRFNRTHHEYDIISGGAPGISDNSWNKFLWSLGARYNASPALAIYANSGSSFVVPSAKAVGGTLLSSDLGVTGKNGQLPNPDLKPESGIGSDIGLDLRPLRTLNIGVRAFYNTVSDMILDNTVSTTPSQTKSINAGKAKSYGLELSAEQFVGKGLQCFGNMTWTRSKVENPQDTDQDGTEITFVPNYVANLGLSAELPWGMQVSPYLHMVGKYYDSTSRSGRAQFGPYQVFNCKLTQSLVKNADYALNCSAEANNLFNRTYAMPWQFQDPGRNFSANLELKF